MRLKWAGASAVYDDVNKAGASIMDRSIKRRFAANRRAFSYQALRAAALL